MGDVTTDGLISLKQSSHDDHVTFAKITSLVNDGRCIKLTCRLVHYIKSQILLLFPAVLRDWSPIFSLEWSPSLYLNALLLSTNQLRELVHRGISAFNLLSAVAVSTLYRQKYWTECRCLLQRSQSIIIFLNKKITICVFNWNFYKKNLQFLFF